VTRTVQIGPFSQFAYRVAAAILLSLGLAACDFEPSVTPIVWVTPGEPPFQQPLEPPTAEVPEEPINPEQPPTPDIGEIEGPECLTVGSVDYCVGQELATSGGLNVRDSGSIAGEIVAVLPCGATVTIQGMPQASGADGHTWAPVVSSTGQTGWAAVDVLDADPPTCAIPSVGDIYPGAGEDVFLSDLPFEEDIYELDFWWGFGNNTFAQENKCVWYERTSGMHSGLDFGLPYNSELSWTGSEDGEVVGVNGEGVNLGAGPNSIVIESEGFYFLYGHTSDEEPSVEIGQTIQPGELIGYSGNPSGEDGEGNDHLHFEIRPTDDRSVVINPLTFVGSDQQSVLTDYFAGDYEGEEAPMSLGYYTLTTLAECFEE